MKKNKLIVLFAMTLLLTFGVTMSCEKNEVAPADIMAIENYKKDGNPPADWPNVKIEFAPGDIAGFNYPTLATIIFDEPSSAEDGLSNGKNDKFVFINHFNPDAPYYTGALWHELWAEMKLSGNGNSLGQGMLKQHHGVNVIWSYNYDKLKITITESDDYDIELYYLPLLFDTLQPNKWGWPDVINRVEIDSITEALYEYTGIPNMIPNLNSIDSLGYSDLGYFVCKFIEL